MRGTQRKDLGHGTQTSSFICFASFVYSVFAQQKQHETRDGSTSRAGPNGVVVIAAVEFCLEILRPVKSRREAKKGCWREMFAAFARAGVLSMWSSTRHMSAAILEDSTPKTTPGGSYHEHRRLDVASVAQTPAWRRYGSMAAASWSATISAQDPAKRKNWSLLATKRFDLLRAAILVMKEGMRSRGANLLGGLVLSCAW